jgi:hypothetical protein
MSESLHASNGIGLTPRYYRFAVPAYGSFVRHSHEDLTREGNEIRREQLKALEKAAVRPRRYPDIVIGLAAALEMRAGADIQYEAFMGDYDDLRTVRGRKPEPWQTVNAERALVHARSMLEFGELLETAITDGCDSLEEAEYVYMIARGKPTCSAMALIAKIS